MGADPIAMCGSCREVVAMFHLTSCVRCINDNFNTDINEKSGRVLSKINLNKKKFWSNCCSDDKCE
jgi:predicted nucleic-acid-binding Zn-ribbon protein